MGGVAPLISQAHPKNTLWGPNIEFILKRNSSKSNRPVQCMTLNALHLWENYNQLHPTKCDAMNKDWIHFGGCWLVDASSPSFNLKKQCRHFFFTQILFSSSSSPFFITFHTNCLTSYSPARLVHFNYLVEGFLQLLRLSKIKFRKISMCGG